MGMKGNNGPGRITSEVIEKFETLSTKRNEKTYSTGRRERIVVIPDQDIAADLPQ